MDGQFHENSIKSYDEENDEGCFLEVDVQYTENCYSLQHGLSFLPEK